MKSFVEIGEALGVSKQRAYQIYEGAIAKLRGSGKLDEFQDLLYARLSQETEEEKGQDVVGVYLYSPKLGRRSP